MVYNRSFRASRFKQILMRERDTLTLNSMSELEYMITCFASER